MCSYLDSDAKYSTIPKKDKKSRKEKSEISIWFDWALLQYHLHSHVRICILQKQEVMVPSATKLLPSLKLRMQIF